MEWGYYLYQAFGWWSVFVPPTVVIAAIAFARWYINRAIPRQ
jgi:hypothetical protein